MLLHYTKGNIMLWDVCRINHYVDQVCLFSGIIIEAKFSKSHLLAFGIIELGKT